MNFILLPENAIFLITFALILLFGLVEILAIIFGMSVFSHTDTLLSPHIHAGESLFSQGLDWLNIGKVPLFILFILLLSCFSISGMVLQWGLLYALGKPLAGGLVALPAGVISVLFVRKISAVLARFLPQYESSALSEESFIGCMATVVGGTASMGHPAQCRLVDKFQQTHYLRVQPDSEDDIFSPGETIIITARLTSSLFEGMSHPWSEHR